MTHDEFWNHVRERRGDHGFVDYLEDILDVLILPRGSVAETMSAAFDFCHGYDPEATLEWLRLQ